MQENSVCTLPYDYQDKSNASLPKFKKIHENSEYELLNSNEIQKNNVKPKKNLLFFNTESKLKFNPNNGEIFTNSSS